MNTNTKLMERKALAIKAHHESATPEPRGTKRVERNSAQRIVHIDKRNGWVFKVERNGFMGKEKQANRTEYENYLRLKDSERFNGDSPFRLPQTMLIHNVIVMEYVKGEPYTFPTYTDQFALEKETGINDLHWANVLKTRNNLIFIIDMAIGY